MRSFTRQSPARPALIGHRGCGRGAPGGLRENSIASLVAAAALGADWVELDVRRTRDDVLVLAHHATLDTPTPGGSSDVFIVDLDARAAARAGLETLEDALAALPPGLGADIDVKSSLEDALRPAATTTAGLLVPALRRAVADRPVMATSFDPAALLHLKAEVPGMAAGLLAWKHFPLRKAIPAAVHLGLDAVVAHVPSFGKNDVDPAPTHRPIEYTVTVAHDAGLDVVAWCPRPDQVRVLAEAGVDAVVVDDLANVQALLSEPLPGSDTNPAPSG